MQICALLLFPPITLGQTSFFLSIKFNLVAGKLPKLPESITKVYWTPLVIFWGHLWSPISTGPYKIYFLMAFLDKNSVFVPVCSLPFRWWNEAAQHSVGSFCITFWPSGKYPEIGERNVSSIMILHYSSSCIYLFPTFIFYLIVPPLQRHCFTTILSEVTR